MVEMDVVGVRVEMPLNAPVLILRENVVGGRHLPIWIGAAEASAIVSALEGQEPPRPMTHDLVTTMLATFGHRIVEARITDLVDGTFFAVLGVDDRELDVRPSDAIALAIRAGARVVCDEAVLEEAGVLVPGDADAEVAAFREFLEGVDADDFLPGD